MSEFEVFVSKPDFKFNCAHFIVYNGFRERLHGHNYRLSVRLIGNDVLSEDGYLIDFGDVKKACRKICSSLNEFFICPMLSNAMTISEEGSQICLECFDGAKFSLPAGDCARLPIHHSSVEEISHYIFCTILRTIGVDHIRERGIKVMEVGLEEAPNQKAVFRSPIPVNDAELTELGKSKVRVKPSGCFAGNS